MRERTNKGKGVEGTARGRTKSDGIKRRISDDVKKKIVRSLDTENKGDTKSNAISGAIRIIVNKVPYPTYCSPS